MGSEMCIRDSYRRAHATAHGDDRPASGGTFEVVKTTIFLQDIADYARVNAIYSQAFTGEPPARSTVQVAALPAGALVEIEAIALCVE